MIYKILTFLFLLLCSISDSFAEPVKTTLSQKTIGMNESFTVAFSTSEKMAEKPDFSPLLADFDILSTSQSFSSIFTNGKGTQENRWILTLMPKREGNLMLPPISFGKESSLPEMIQVTKASASERDAPFFLETELSPKNEAYEQTQLIFTVRLYLSVNTAQATLSEVKVNDPDAIIEKLGDDRQYEHVQGDGKRFLVLERKVAVFPQKTGELIFSPVVFEARIVKEASPFFNMQGSIRRISSKEEKILIKPVPHPFQKHNWFGADNVALKGEWSSNPAKLSLGEPITWTLTVRAAGVLGNQIPDIQLNLPAGLKGYPDKPQVWNEPKEDGFIGYKQIKVVLIPSIDGEMTIPEISLKWWDLKEDKAKEAILPATDIQVGDGLIAIAPQQAAGQSAPQQAADKSPLPAASKDPAPQAAASEDASFFSAPLPIWFWSMAALNILMAAALAFTLSKKIGGGPLKGIKKEFSRACKAGNAKEAAAFLLAWGEIAFPEEKPLNLLKLKRFVPAQFQNALHALNQAQYGQKMKWRDGDLWKGFKGFEVPKPSCADKKVFRELYPFD